MTDATQVSYSLTISFLNFTISRSTVHLQYDCTCGKRYRRANSDTAKGLTFRDSLKHDFSKRAGADSVAFVSFRGPSESSLTMAIVAYLYYSLSQLLIVV